MSNNRSSSTRYTWSWVSEEAISQSSVCNHFVMYLGAWQLWYMNIENEKSHSAHWGSSFTCTLFSQDIYNHYLNDPHAFCIHSFALWGLLTFIIWLLKKKKLFLITLSEFIFLSLSFRLVTRSAAASWAKKLQVQYSENHYVFILVNALGVCVVVWCVCVCFCFCFF